MSTPYFYLLSALLLSTGLYLVLTKKNVFVVLIGAELILLASIANFVWLHQGNTQVIGQIYALFILSLAIAETVLALALIFCARQYSRHSNIDELSAPKDKPSP